MSALPRTAEVIVVGGGVVGLATALALAEAGLAPVVVEAKSFGGAVTGGSLAGIGAHMHGLPEYDLMRAACGLWRDLATDTGNPFEYRAQGQIGFILDPRDVASGETWVREERALGADCRMLTPAEASEVEPLLTGPIVAATFAPDTATVNPFLAARTLLRRACEKGARAFEHTPITALTVEDDRIRGVQTASGERIAAAHVVLAAGPWTANLAAMANVALPLVPRQAQCLASVRQPPDTLRRVISAVEDAGGVNSGYTQIQQAQSGQILFNTVTAPTATPPEAKDQIREVPPGFVVESIDMLLRLFPALAQIELLRSWVRFEAVSPDHRFLAGPLPVAGLWVCAGDNGSGYCRALMLGRYMAGRIGGGASLPDALIEQAGRLYDPARFGEVA
ncbi:FAD-binding oxidoreductase [Tropicimonas sp. IMCC34043]|uniref:NAD(P)/FAD-dependent oxidoreductase n=1 Tax=Tropicimonas sp. IMCC34043 TaxID=2248760 RepID=UPI000E2595CA|nr:FAD-dependent oxidoreductase [Tropicimonas sp. IMCC34043]